MQEWVALAGQAAALAGVVLVAGVVAFELLVLRRRDDPRLLRMGALASAGIALVAPVRWWAQARALVDAGDPAWPMMVNVLNTTWGHALALQAGAAMLSLGGFVIARRGRPAGWLMAAAGAAALCACPAFMGHAAAAERRVALSVLVDVLHVAAASAWIGGLACLTLVLVQTARSEPGDQAGQLIDRFHPVALTAALTLVGSGIVSLFFRLDRIADLLPSAYGTTLIVKLALTAGVAGLGARHARHGSRLVRAHGPRALAASLIGEVVLAAGVLASTAVLVGTAPPMHDTTP